jgi:hypothetical protein
MKPITSRSAIIDTSSPDLHAVSRLGVLPEHPDPGADEAHPEGVPPDSGGTERSR